jgi:hypothetical protein
MNWSSASEREQVRRTSFSVASIASQHDEEARQAETIELFSQKEVLDARILRAAMLTLVLRSVRLFCKMKFVRGFEGGISGSRTQQFQLPWHSIINSWTISLS